MSLTRKLLKELELNDAAIERVIAAHTTTVEALKQERDQARARIDECEAAQQELAELRPQLEEAQANSSIAQAQLVAYRTQVEVEKHHTARRAALSEALEKHGANPSAIPLMLDAIPLPADAWDGDALVDPDATLLPFQQKYAPLFAKRTAIPVTKVQPPIAGAGSLTPADVMRMSADDINRNWSAVKTALNNHR